MPSPTPSPTVRNMPTTSALTLQPAPDWALFLDVDGTILHLRDTPDSVEAGENLLDILEVILGRLDGAVALVSGRSISILDALFSPHRCPRPDCTDWSAATRAELSTGSKNPLRWMSCGHPCSSWQDRA